MPEAASPYESVVYPGYAYPQTHPDQTAALAHLCGLTPAPLENCRVLEVGCGDAANLIPMAFDLPRASFRGFDLAESSIDRGKKLVREAGLTNLTLEQLDILDAPEYLGEFDYIIAHGFYSWVPPSARDKLFAICRASLAPQGIAFVSYNTMPGGHIRRMVREMMLFHIERAHDPEKRINQARALLGFLRQICHGDDAYQRILKEELERVYKYPPGYLYHDDLSPFNDPVYLHEFVSHASGYDLQFLGDLNSSFVHLSNIDEVSAQALRELEGDAVLREQYLDFASCRRFRQTLLCRTGLAVTQHLTLERLGALLVSSPAVPASGKTELGSDEEEEFRTPRNASLKTSHPVMKAAMASLFSAWPERLAFDRLRETVAKLLDVPSDSITDTLRQGVAFGFSMRVVELHFHATRATSHPAGYPKTTALVRLQASKGNSFLTNLNHETVKVAADTLNLLPLLDGSRSLQGLAEELHASVVDLSAVLSQLARMALIEE